MASLLPRTTSHIKINTTNSPCSQELTGQVHSCLQALLFIVTQTKPCVHQDPAEGAETPQEIELGLPVCPGVSGTVWVNSGLLRGQEH